MSNAVATSENGKILSSRMITAFYESYWCNIDDDGDKDNHNNDDINIKNGNVSDNDNENHNDDNSRDEILLLLICDEIREQMRPSLRDKLVSLIANFWYRRHLAANIISKNFSSSRI